MPGQNQRKTKTPNSKFVWSLDTNNRKAMEDYLELATRKTKEENVIVKGTRKCNKRKK